MYNILLSVVLSTWCMESIFAAAGPREALLDSLKNKDIEATQSLLKAGAKPETGMLVMCKTRAQAEALVAHGADIKNESREYGFLLEFVAPDAEPGVFVYFLERVPLTVRNKYGREAYTHLLFGIPDGVTDFDEKLQILMDYNCYCDFRQIMYSIDKGLSDFALGHDRGGIRKKFEQIAVKNESENNRRNEENHRRKKKIDQYEKQKRKEAAEKGLTGLELLFYDI
jgi:hypothetical protein